MNPELTEIDLVGTTRLGGNGLGVGPLYLCLVGGCYYIGTFDEQWYGLNFSNGMHSFQYDPPGENFSNWQKVWKFDNADVIAESLEHEFAVRRREYAIQHKLESNGKTIDDTSPVEAFYYRPKVYAMPIEEEVEEDEESSEY